MKSTLALQTTAAAAALFLAACASVNLQDSDQFIFLDESETLFIQFRHSANPMIQSSMPDLADNMEDNRRRDFMDVMQQLLYVYQLPINVHVLTERESPGDGPLLEIHAFRFEQDTSGDLVATLRARLSKYGELNTLGTYSQRDVPPVSMSRHQMDQAFQDVLRKPLREIMEDLLQHFPSPEEKEVINAAPDVES